MPRVARSPSVSVSSIGSPVASAVSTSVNSLSEACTMLALTPLGVSPLLAVSKRSRMSRRLSVLCSVIVVPLTSKLPVRPRSASASAKVSLPSFCALATCRISSSWSATLAALVTLTDRRLAAFAGDWPSVRRVVANDCLASKTSRESPTLIAP